MKKHWYIVIAIFIGITAGHLGAEDNFYTQDVLPIRTATPLLPFEQEYIRIMHFYATQEQHYTDKKEVACLTFYTMAQLKELVRVLPDTREFERLKSIIHTTLDHLKPFSKGVKAHECNDLIGKFATIFHETLYKELLTEQLRYATSL